MTIQDLYAFVVLLNFVAPVTLIVYLAVLLFIRPPKAVLLASLLGGLLMGLVNLFVDLAAYYAHWWHYTLKELIFHLPLPFYMLPILIYGSLMYLLIWRLWNGRAAWLARMLLFGVPIFGILRDIVGVQIGATYVAWDSPLAALVTILLWPIMFYGGFFLFKRFSPSQYAGEHAQEPEANLEKSAP